ncbi:MAG: T9SS type A sorting domain-containing protein, partial [Bacteroidota bacterium]|nr:T9SS type A sorting domain-containing protein [Bacteroidota bacterium]
TLVSIEGNCTVQLDLKDVSKDGTGDLVGITVYRNKGGVWYSNNWTGTKTEMKAICGGGILVSGSDASKQVTNTTSTKVVGSNVNTINTAVEEVTPEAIGKLKVAVYPNPSTRYFTLQINSNITKDAITLRVVDLSGKLVELRNNLQAGQTLRLGDKYRPGMYFVEVLQGNGREVLKLVKQPG